MEFKLREYTRYAHLDKEEQTKHLKQRQFKAYRKHYIKKQEEKIQTRYYLECYEEFLELLEEDDCLESDDENKLDDGEVEFFQEQIDWLEDVLEL